MTDKMQQPQDKNKRSFIKKAAITASISTMAPASVWGACNASGVSGGSKDIHNICVVPTFMCARAPVEWSMYLKHSPTNYDRKSIVLSMITGFNNRDRIHVNGNDPKKYNYYYWRVRALLNKDSFRVHTKDKSGMDHSLTVKVSDALSPSNVDSGDFSSHMSAIYISYLLGFVKLTHEYDTHGGFELLANHLFGVYINNPSNFTDNIGQNYDPHCTIDERWLRVVLEQKGVI